jgi:hypothetical protein
MTELLNDPALTPSLIGFLVGVVFTSIFAAIRGKLSRSVALAKEKVTEEKLSAFQSKTSALENEISTLRSSETRFLKHQAELEALAQSDLERREEMKNFLDSTQATLTAELKRQEMVLKEAINKNQGAPGIQTGFGAPSARAAKPAPQTGLEDDRDFVPLQNPAGEGPEENQFEGFAPDPSIEKAESAANSLRAAIEEGNL